jgi:hypothetical protein
MDTLPGYQNFLESKRLVAEKKLSFYLHWVSTFISYCHKEGCSPADDSRILSVSQFSGQEQRGLAG